MSHLGLHFSAPWSESLSSAFHLSVCILLHLHVRGNSLCCAHLLAVFGPAHVFFRPSFHRVSPAWTCINSSQLLQTPACVRACIGLSWSEDTPPKNSNAHSVPMSTFYRLARISSSAWPALFPNILALRRSIFLALFHTIAPIM
jgi:hypothetical protein